MSIIPPIRTANRQIQASAFVRAICICLFLGCVLDQALVRADNWDNKHMMARLKELEDENPEIRRNAARDIGLYGQKSKDEERKEVILALKRHLQDADKLVRYNAAEALPDIDSTAKEVLPILIEALKDNDKAVDPLIAALSLRHFGPEAKDAVPVLIDLMKKEGISYPWGYPVSNYGDILRNIGTPEALAALKPLRRRELLATALLTPFGILMLPALAPLTSLCFAVLFWWSRAQCKRGRKIIHWPLLISTLSWAYVAYVVMFEMPKTGAIGGALEGIFCLWLLIITTLAGLVPWSISWLLLRLREQHMRSPATFAPEEEMR